MVQYASLYDDQYRYRAERPYNHDKWKFLRRWDKLNGMTWIEASKGAVPPGAVVAGHQDGQTLYVGRAECMSSVAVGVVKPHRKACFVPWGGKAHKRETYEVLCTPGQFVPIDSCTTLLKGTPGGISEQGEPLYIGRTSHQGALIGGKIQRSYFMCYLPYKNREVERLVFESEIFIKSS
uniref:Uncharacterized protein n=1 Tax=Culex tarsalis TaxID=7177 RepID=A0A1Q3F1W1_CULTA